MNRYYELRTLTVSLLISSAFAINPVAAKAQSQSATTNSMARLESASDLPKSTIWQSGVGQGFQPTAQTFSVEPGMALGIATFGSREAHDLALLSLSYGHMLGGVKGEGHWYRGNFELRGELFGGGDYSNTGEWFIGLTPHLRYNFATGTRWIPFFDAGAGVTATGIGPPDLSGTFEFNLQAATGVHWFVRDNLALTSEVRYMHMSCGGINSPNLGINNVAFLVGLTWVFGK